MALYRDYRPGTFAEIIGQDYIKKTLQNAVAKGSFSHAYLFTGTRGTGKTSTARILARAINSPTKSGEPDNDTDISKAFLSGTSLDLVEIDAASNTGVENVREIIEGLKFTPSHAKYKVFIIDEVHMLSKGAFNALLKTLEEPPAHAVFVLATTEIQKVPATIISRTQRFDFKRIEHAELVTHLKQVAKKEKIDIDSESLELVASAAEGSVRDALSILDKLASFGKVNLAETERILGITNVSALQKLLDLLASKDSVGSLEFLLKVLKDGADPNQLNKDFLEYLRKVMILGMGAKDDFVLDKEQKEVLKKQASSIKTPQLLYIIRLFLRAAKDAETSPNASLPLEIAVAEACLGNSTSSTPTPRLASVEKKTENTEPVSTKAEEVGEEPEESRLEDFTPVSHEQLSEAWPEIMGKLRSHASTLFAVMKNAKLKGVKDNKVTLTFIYKFHKESLENKKNKDLLLKIISDHFKTGFLLEVLVEGEKGPESDSESLAMEVFGA